MVKKIPTKKEVGSKKELPSSAQIGLSALESILANIQSCNDQVVCKAFNIIYLSCMRGSRSRLMSFN